MVLIELLELCIAVLFLLFIITQIVVPMWQNKPYFPNFRTKARNLESQLSDLRGETDEAVFEDEIKRERDRADRLRSQNAGGGAKDKN